MKFDNLKAVALAKSNRGLMLANKYSPEILLGTGIAGVVGSTILACRATLKAQTQYELLKENFDLIEQVHADGDKALYSDEDYKRDKTLAVAQFGLQALRLYGPAILMSAVSIGMLVGSHRILTKRNAGLIAAYKAIDEAYKEYRRRVKTELGEDVDRYFRYKQPREGKMQIVDEKKKPICFDELEAVLPGETEDDIAWEVPSSYAVFFDETSPQWRKDRTYNEVFLKTQEIHANQLLRSQGHVFLNEIYDSLSVQRTKAGAVVGWVEGHGDDFIDFDIFNPYNSSDGNTLNNQQSYLLDFNVDGVIYDMI